MKSELEPASDRKSFSRREALKIIGTTLAAGLAVSIKPRSQSNPDGNADDLALIWPEAIASPQLMNATAVEKHPFGAQATRPNIIFILGDNHSHNAMGCAGHPFIQTPALNQLAKEGALFETAFSTTPLCSPSRASILTGAYAHKHGVRNNHTPWTGQMTTFLEHLSRHSYATAFIGKWHMPGKGLPEMPFLDRFISYTYREGQGAYFHCPLIVDGEKVPSRKAYITEELTDYAIEFIRHNLTRAKEERPPFCVYLSHRAGHPPYQAPEGIAGMYDTADVRQILPDFVDPWWYGKANRNIFQGVMMGSYYDQYRKYCETLTVMDHEIARLLQLVDQTGLRENTIIIYMGDNGMQWGTHDCHGIREPYEESIRLPLIIRAPWLISGIGGRRQQMVLNIDIAPTLLEIAGVPIPQEIDGHSLVQQLIYPEIPGRTSFLLEYWRYFPENTPSYSGIRTERFKYIEFERGRNPWLFDLRKDPAENANLYDTSEAKAMISELKAAMEALN